MLFAVNSTVILLTDYFGKVYGGVSINLTVEYLAARLPTILHKMWSIS